MKDYEDVVKRWYETERTKLEEASKEEKYLIIQRITERNKLADLLHMSDEKWDKKLYELSLSRQNLEGKLNACQNEEEERIIFNEYRIVDDLCLVY